MYPGGIPGITAGIPGIIGGTPGIIGGIPTQTHNEREVLTSKKKMTVSYSEGVHIHENTAHCKYHNILHRSGHQ